MSIDTAGLNTGGFRSQGAEREQVSEDRRRSDQRDMRLSQHMIISRMGAEGVGQKRMNRDERKQNRGDKKITGSEGR